LRVHNQDTKLRYTIDLKDASKKLDRMVDICDIFFLKMYARKNLEDKKRHQMFEISLGTWTYIVSTHNADAFVFEKPISTLLLHLDLYFLNADLNTNYQLIH
jgi:predicted acetyltransferase